MAGISGIKAGKAFVLIEAIDATGKVLNAVRNRMGKFGTELSNIGRTMALRAIGALTPVALATKVGTSYDDMMRKVEARSEGTAKEMQILRDQTLKLGRALGILPSQMGSIQNIFAQAGFSRKEIASIGPAVATLARAGGEGKDAMQDTDNAAKALGSVLRGFEMDASQAADVVDALAVALNASNFNLEDITTSLQYAVPAAKFYNVTMEEMLAILGAMRDLQIDASIAGTAFRNMMMYMSQPKEMEKFNEQLTAMGGKTVEFKDAVGNLHSPIKILMAMLKATEGMGTADRSALFTGILQARATIPGAAVGRSSARMADMLTRLGNRGGTASKVQKQMDSGLGGAFRRFAATLEEVAIKLQQAIAPSLNTVTTAIDGMIKAVADWTIKNAGLVATITAAVVGMLALGTAMVVVGQLIIAGSAIVGLGAALASTTAYLLAFVAPWALAAGGIWLAINAIDEFTGKTEIAKTATNAFIDSGNKLKQVGTSIAATWKETAKYVVDQWSTSLKSIMGAMQAGDVDAAFQVLSAQLKLTWAQMVNYLITKWEEFMQFLAETKSQLGNNSFIREMGAQAAALAAYHSNANNPDKAKIGAQAYEDYKKHFDETFKGKFAEAQSGNPARLEAQRKRAEIIDKLLMELSAANAKAGIAQEKAAGAAEAANSTFNAAQAQAAAVDEKKRQMEAEAAALIGAGSVRTTPKGAVNAIDYRSKEFMEAFREGQYNAYGDKATEIAADQLDELAAIRGLLERDEGVGLV